MIDCVWRHFHPDGATEVLTLQLLINTFDKVENALDVHETLAHDIVLLNEHVGHSMGIFTTLNTSLSHTFI